MRGPIGIVSPEIVPEFAGILLRNCVGIVPELWYHLPGKQFDSKGRYTH